MEHTCKNCGTEYDGNFCPECGTPAAAVTKRRRKYTAVLVALGALVGFTLGFAACTVYAFSLGIVTFEGGLPAIVIQETIPASTPTPPSSDPATSSVATTAPTITSPAIVPSLGNASTANIGDYSVAIVGLTPIKDNNGNDSVEILIDITNNSEQVIAAFTALSVVPSQNGVELKECSDLSPDTPSEDLFSVVEEISPDTTVRCHYYYILHDTTSPINVEIRDIFEIVDPVSFTFDLP